MHLQSKSCSSMKPWAGSQELEFRDHYMHTALHMISIFSLPCYALGSKCGQAKLISALHQRLSYQSKEQQNTPPGAASGAYGLPLCHRQCVPSSLNQFSMFTSASTSLRQRLQILSSCTSLCIKNQLIFNTLPTQSVHAGRAPPDCICTKE